MIDEYWEKHFSHMHWVKEIGKHINEDNSLNIIRFALSYTLQSIRAGENLDRFKWR